MDLLHHPVWSGWVNAEWLWAGEGSGSVVVVLASTPAFFAFSSWHWQSGRRRAQWWDSDRSERDTFKVSVDISSVISSVISTVLSIVISSVKSSVIFKEYISSVISSVISTVI